MRWENILNFFRCRSSPIRQQRVESFPGERALSPLPGSSSKGEMLCVTCLEKITGRRFIKVRPDCLKNPVTGQCLELDAYHEGLKLGLEYNGIQHYRFTSFFHKNYEDFMCQRYRDHLKKELCRSAGISLLIVSYKHKTEEEICREIYRQLEKMKFSFPRSLKETDKSLQ